MGEDLKLGAILPRPQDARAFLHKIKKAANEEGGHEWDKEDVKSLLFWFKQALALAIGLALPIAGLQGWAGFAVALSLVFFACSSLKQRLHIPDDVMETGEIFNEGLAQCSQLFLLVWICTHTALHANKGVGSV
eukprot:Gregarina_sp_Pseudo_9__4014@NODE_4156_length_475_cov_32_362385_g3827_i0_p1_GENE_NODE_4156_length_475_cov_32_362385_g3827_i0NODE_4156_length_475_cov_32_362385_g3827_i0_p1_ORF_typecomplete_len134_score34_60Rab5ip/PF07019_12/2_3e08_NODE_4156_length_475_cov_32_362385_g3827_i018419